jgi:mono/diheme cytochrome c family protein
MVFLLSLGWPVAGEYLLGRNDKMVQRLLMTIGLAGIFLVLVGCQDSAGEPSPATEARTEPIVPSLPSISELAGTSAPEIPPLPALGSDEIAVGREVYATNCAECHGANLEGEAEWQKQNEDNSFRSPPHDDTGHTWHHGDEVLIESIVLGGARLPDNIGGSSDMPAFGDTLTDAEITAVLSYIKSTWSEDVRSIQWEQTIQEGNQ